jgi:hypothetical protein
MAVKALGRAPARLGAAVALAAACAALLIAASSGTARADSGDWFCPWNNGAGGFITLGANTGCTSSFYNALTKVAYYHRDGANVDHCAVSKWTDDPGGSGSNAIPARCGYGAAPYGLIATDYYGSGVWSYARGKNNEGVTHYGFYGFRWWI